MISLTQALSHQSRSLVPPPWAANARKLFSKHCAENHSPLLDKNTNNDLQTQYGHPVHVTMGLKDMTMSTIRVHSTMVSLLGLTWIHMRYTWFRMGTYKDSALVCYRSDLNTESDLCTHS